MGNDRYICFWPGNRNINTEEIKEILHLSRVIIGRNRPGTIKIYDKATLGHNIYVVTDKGTEIQVLYGIENMRISKFIATLIAGHLSVKVIFSEIEV